MQRRFFLPFAFSLCLPPTRRVWAQPTNTVTQAEADEAAKKKAQDEKQAAVRAENCKRAQQAKVGLESGTPMKQTNAQGERVFLDEAGRNAEIKRIQGIIDADCKR